FDLGGTADLDHGNAAGELRQPLLQLLLVVVRGGVLDLLLDLGDARLDVGLLAGAVDDRGIILGDRHLLRLAKHVDGDILELDAEILGDQLAAGEQAMSCSMALRRSPKPGALTAATFKPPRSLLTTRVASASPSTSSAITS